MASNFKIKWKSWAKTDNKSDLPYICTILHYIWHVLESYIHFISNYGSTKKQ